MAKGSDTASDLSGWEKRWLKGLDLGRGGPRDFGVGREDVRSDPSGGTNSKLADLWHFGGGFSFGR